MIGAVAALTIRWLGQACFLITTIHGAAILIDPPHPEVGYPITEHSIQATAVFVSHEHSDHNWTDAAAGHPTIVQPISAPAPNQHGEIPAPGDRPAVITYTRIFAYHDNDHGADRGPDTITVMDVDGVRIVHLGDLGQYTLTHDQLHAIGPVDVLMIPVGGFYTIDGQQASVIVSELHPKVVIPMHYRTPALNADLQSKLATPDEFEQAMADQAQTVTVSTRDLTLDPKHLPRHETIYILKYE